MLTSRERQIDHWRQFANGWRQKPRQSVRNPLVALSHEIYFGGVGRAAIIL
jgi:hypothetical protein